MTVGNIHSGSKVLVFDDCMGMVVASIMERIGGYGLVFAVNNNDNRIPAYDCVNRLNFNAAEDRNEYIVDHEGSHGFTEIPIPQRDLTISDYQNNIRNTLLIWHLSDLIKVTPIGSIMMDISQNRSSQTTCYGRDTTSSTTCCSRTDDCLCAQRIVPPDDRTSYEA